MLVFSLDLEKDWFHWIGRFILRIWIRVSLDLVGLFLGSGRSFNWIWIGFFKRNRMCCLRILGFSIFCFKLFSVVLPFKDLLTLISKRRVPKCNRQNRFFYLFINLMIFNYLLSLNAAIFKSSQDILLTTLLYRWSLSALIFLNRTMALPDSWLPKYAMAK